MVNLRNIGVDKEGLFYTYFYMYNINRDRRDRLNDGELETLSRILAIDEFSLDSKSTGARANLFKQIGGDYNSKSMYRHLKSLEDKDYLVPDEDGILWLSEYLVNLKNKVGVGEKFVMSLNIDGYDTRSN